MPLPLAPKTLPEWNMNNTDGLESNTVAVQVVHCPHVSELGVQLTDRSVTGGCIVTDADARGGPNCETTDPNCVTTLYWPGGAIDAIPFVESVVVNVPVPDVSIVVEYCRSKEKGFVALAILPSPSKSIPTKPLAYAGKPAPFTVISCPDLTVEGNSVSEGPVAKAIAGGTVAKTENRNNTAVVVAIIILTVL